MNLSHVLGFTSTDLTSCWAVSPTKDWSKWSTQLPEIPNRSIKYFWLSLCVDSHWPIAQGYDSSKWEKLTTKEFMLLLNLWSINNIMKLFFVCCQFYSFRNILNVKNWSMGINAKGKSETLHREARNSWWPSPPYSQESAQFIV